MSGIKCWNLFSNNDGLFIVHYPRQTVLYCFPDNQEFCLSQKHNCENTYMWSFKAKRTQLSSEQSSVQVHFSQMKGFTLKCIVQ